MGSGRFERVFRQAPLGIAWGPATGDGSLLEVNERFAAMFGYTPEELVTMSVMDFTHPLDRARTDDFMVALRGGRSVRYEKRYVRRDGSIFWGATNAAVILDERGAPDVFAVHIEDLTKHRHSMEELGRRTQQLEESQRRTQIGSFEWIPEEDRPRVSEHMYSVLGWDRGEPAPTVAEFLAAVHPEDRHLVETEILQLLRPGVAEYRFRHRDGHYVRLQTIGGPVFDEDGRPVRVIGTTRDVTRQRALEMALREAEHFEAAFDGTACALLLLDADAHAPRIAHANAAAGILLECPPESLEGRPAADLLPAGQGPPALQAVLQGTSEHFGGEVLLDRGDGRSVTTRLEAFVTRPDDGRQAFVVLMARERPVAVADAEPTQTLSEREREVLEHVAAGHGGFETAALLQLSPETIKTHLHRIYAKLGVSDRAAAVAVAMRRGLVS